NRGGADLVVSNLQIVGNAAFTIGGANNLPITLPPIDINNPDPTASGLRLTVQFDPVADGELDAVLQIASNQFGDPTVSIPLRGLALPATGRISVLVSNNNIGGASLGKSAEVRGFATIQNLGTKALQVTSVKTSTGIGEYIATPTAGNAIPTAL